jgi:hypothetical protein
MNDFTNWRGQGQLEPVKATPDAVSALTKLVSGWMDRRKQSQQGGGPRQRPWHEDALLHAHKAQTDLEKTLAIKDFENKGKADEAMIKAAGEAHLVRVKADEERKTTSTAVMQENQRLKNFTAMGVNVENIADLTTKNNTADLRIRLRAPEKPEDETSSKDFSAASDKTPRSGAKRRGRKDAFDGGRGVEPTTATEESAAPATPTPSGGTRNPFVIPGANPMPTIRPATPTIHTLRPTSTENEDTVTAAAAKAHEENKIGKPCTFCGETIEHSYDANVTHASLPNGWCQHAFGAVGGGGAWNTDKDK